MILKLKSESWKSYTAAAALSAVVPLFFFFLFTTFMPLRLFLVWKSYANKVDFTLAATLSCVTVSSRLDKYVGGVRTFLVT